MTNLRDAMANMDQGLKAIATDLLSEIEDSTSTIDQLKERQRTFNTYLEQVMKDLKEGFNELFEALISVETTRVARLTIKANELSGNIDAPVISHPKRPPLSAV